MKDLPLTSSHLFLLEKKPSLDFRKLRFMLEKETNMSAMAQLLQNSFDLVNGLTDG